MAIGHGQTISRRYIVALMTRLLRLEGGEKILEIETGLGYQTVVLSKFTSDIYTTEIIPDLHQKSLERLRP